MAAWDYLSRNICIWGITLMQATWPFGVTLSFMDKLDNKSLCPEIYDVYPLVYITGKGDKNDYIGLLHW